MEQAHTEECYDIRRVIMEELFNFEKEFKKVMEMDSIETQNLKQQIFHVNQDRIKLHQDNLMMETRVHQGEVEIGIVNAKH